MSMPLMRVWAVKGMNVALSARHVAAADAVFLLGQHDDGAALGRLVGQRGELRRVGEFLSLTPVYRNEFRGLAVAERDRAGLVEQQRIDVARRLDGAARHREHIEAHQSVHAGDADRRQQRADRGRDQGHEQRHQHQHRHDAAGIGGEARNRRHGEDEDDRQAGEQDVERDLVRRLLALRAFDQRDHAVEEGRARRRRDRHLDPVGDHRRAAGDRRAVAAALADDGRGFAGDRRFVDRGDAFDDVAVARDEIAGLDQHDIALLQRRRRHFAPRDVAVAPLRRDSSLAIASVLLWRSARGLRLAAAFRDRFGEIREEHGEPEPEIDLEGEAVMAERR